MFPPLLHRRPILPLLPYEPPTLGRDYWLLDAALADPDALRAR